MTEIEFKKISFVKYSNRPLWMSKEHEEGMEIKEKQIEEIDHLLCTYFDEVF